jgi:hypothetical protein
MAQQICNQFEPTTNTSSATICKWCGQEKFLHAPKVGNMAQQTAVEWLIEQLSKKDNEFQALTFYYDHKDEIEQAKAMEKEQIKDAVMYGLDEDGHTGDWKISVAQNYYNKTFTDGNSGAKAD